MLKLIWPWMLVRVIIWEKILLASIQWVPSSCLSSSSSSWTARSHTPTWKPLYWAGCIWFRTSIIKLHDMDYPSRSWMIQSQVVSTVGFSCCWMMGFLWRHAVDISAWRAEVGLYSGSCGYAHSRRARLCKKTIHGSEGGIREPEEDGMDTAWVYIRWSDRGCIFSYFRVVF